MHEGPLVCDTTVLLYLGRVGLARLLPELFESVIVPEQVAGELDVGRQLRSDTLDPRALSWATMVNVGDSEIAALPPNDLGLGERSVIAHALSHPETTAGLDDRAARDLAKSVGVTVTGILGVLLRAIHAGMLTDIVPILDSLQHEGFHLGDALRQEVIRLAGTQA